MKLISISTFFSTKLKSKLKKNHCNKSPSFRSTATTSKSVLRPHDLFGKITKRELEIVLRLLSPKPPTEEELASMVSEIDRDGDGCISLDVFGPIGPDALGPPTCGGELRDAFAVFDADGDGKISAEELLAVFLALGEGGCTLEDCHRMIRAVDSDGDGFVCFADFARMMGRTDMVGLEK